MFFIQDYNHMLKTTFEVIRFSPVIYCAMMLHAGHVHCSFSNIHTNLFIKFVEVMVATRGNSLLRAGESFAQERFWIVVGCNGQTGTVVQILAFVVSSRTLLSFLLLEVSIPVYVMGIFFLLAFFSNVLGIVWYAIENYDEKEKKLERKREKKRKKDVVWYNMEKRKKISIF